ncbi:ferredoxin [Catenulispora sp. MAP12-49]|uniref:ferredoxin n=1 Tax=unclassified Catenulispora TaxID=414885 RepID=UPI0035175D6B
MSEIDAAAQTKWRVTVDADLCIGSGGCVLRSPEAFELDVARQACPRHEVLGASDEVLDAAENCPVEAITIVEEGSGLAVFPPAD